MTNPRIYSRRAFVWRAATGIGSILAANPLSVFAGDIKPKPENIISPKEALDRLIEGNKRYIAGTPLPLEFSKTREALSSGQNPYACILGCADSRVAPELCFDAGIGDLFVTRVAGNFVTPQILASLEYGTEFLGAPLIMVLGHTKCGAIDATIKSIKDDAVFPGHIQNLVTDMSGSINAAEIKNPADLEMTAIRQNVKINVKKLSESTPILRRRVKRGELKVVGGIYHLTTGLVEIV